MRILYFGDIVGDKVLKVLKDNIEEIKREYKVNMVLANGENITSGKGLSFKHYKELRSLGVCGVSMGNHTFSKSEIKDFINEEAICRPANLNTEYGKGYIYIKYNDKTIALVNMLGRVFLNTPLDCPFQTMDKLLEEIKADHIIVDFHAEATSEKKAFFYEYAGKVDAVVGSHTHTQTADEQVLNNTCFITDMGMCGAYNSILGDDTQSIIKRFRSGVYEPLSVANDNEFIINAVVLDLNDVKNTITRVNKKIVMA
ncbi:MAG: YmdB family metallophosphoesterase [Erysipelotrichaceae bacterium]|nr:YmdB family metallophosphoesterase [Erysipelotrichaceae bacterium]